MFILDTDTLTLLERGQERVVEKVRLAPGEVVTTAVTRIEILQGRFASVLKAEEGSQLLIAQERLIQAELRLQGLRILPIDAATADAFDRLLATKGLRKIGRGDLLIASICRAFEATLVTRNLKDFRKVPGLNVENWAD